MPRPRQRQRTVVCDCFDCRDDLFGDRSEPRPEDLTAASRAARQDPPPKAIIIHACGFLRQLDGILNVEQTRVPHLDVVVREGNLGMVAARPIRPHAGRGVERGGRGAQHGLFSCHWTQGCKVHPPCTRSSASSTHIHFPSPPSRLHHLCRTEREYDVWN